MAHGLKYLIFFLCVVSCIEPYDFVVHDDGHTLVVEAYITDKSFNETLTYPSDGRYFTTKLSYTSDVINIRPTLISGATVTLVDDRGEIWVYTESPKEAGMYKLLNDDFRALSGVTYKLQIMLPDESRYESSWEQFPVGPTPTVGEVTFNETEKQKYGIEAGEQALQTVKGIIANIGVPVNDTGMDIYYRWDYTPTWIYIAPLSSVSDPGNKCWATSNTYLPDYALQIDHAGGYTKELFFLQTIRNEKLFEDFSVLVTQYRLSEEYYSFWREMQEQVQGGLFDAPPYNLHTNIQSLGDDNLVSGYFGVAQEQAKRWYFNKGDLSYHVENTLKADCLVDYHGPPAPECLDCREYSFGTAVTVKPAWWRR